ncbi:MAG: NAD(P)-dependent oxidoreductase [Pseudorhodoplanes sp.]
MKIAVIGASGRGGSRIVQELVRRGHQVTAIARNVEKLPSGPNIVARKGDVHDAGLADLLKGHDAVVSAVRFTETEPERLIGTVKKSGVKRYLVMGGAGSLEIAPGKKLIDTPNFPAAYKPEASKGGEFLDLLRQENDLDWTFLSPSALIEIGERTGKFRTGGDQLLTDANGNSRITFEDYAIAMVDEVENPKHSRKRFTVGY